MSEKNKAILEEANAAVAEGDYEGFLSFCTDDTEWTFIGDKTLKGKEAVRQWMVTEYVEPPLNIVANLIAEGFRHGTWRPDNEGRRREGGSLLILRCLAFSQR